MVCEIHQIVRIPQDWTSERNGRTLFAPTAICADIASVNRQKIGCRGRQTLHGWFCAYTLSVKHKFVLWVGVPQNRSALCGFYIALEDRKAVQFGFFDTAFAYVANLSFFFFRLHRLVGCRRMRLCPFLVSGVEQEIYSAGALPLDPTSPLAPGLSLRFIARFARWCFYFVCFLQLHYIFFRRRKCVCTVCCCCYYLS